MLEELSEALFVHISCCRGLMTLTSTRQKKTAISAETTPCCFWQLILAKYSRTKSREAANHPGHWQVKKLGPQQKALQFKKGHEKPKVVLLRNNVN